jgi:hypothetical protein
MEAQKDENEDPQHTTAVPNKEIEKLRTKLTSKACRAIPALKMISHAAKPIAEINEGITDIATVIALVDGTGSFVSDSKKYFKMKYSLDQVVDIFPDLPLEFEVHFTGKCWNIDGPGAIRKKLPGIKIWSIIDTLDLCYDKSCNLLTLKIKVAEHPRERYV